MAYAPVDQVRDRVKLLSTVASCWRNGTPEFDDAVQRSVECTGYPRSEVEGQLERSVSWCTDPAAAIELASAEAGAPLERFARPDRLLHVVAGTVPGLTVESVTWGLLLGSHNQLRPARADGAIGAFARLLERTAPPLAGLLSLHERTPVEDADAAVVYGSNETVEAVRQRLPSAAPMAAFGTRVGIAVVSPQVDVDLLAGDISRFGQRGCMSPRAVLVVGDARATALVASRLHAALGHVSAAGRPPWLGDAVADRRSHDLTLLAGLDDAEPEQGSLADGDLVTAMTAPPALAELGPGSVAVAPIATHRALEEFLAPHLPLLQTAVVDPQLEAPEAVGQVLLEAGCSRVCAPGQAHFPAPSWLHEGVGRLSTLLRPLPG